MAVESGSGSDMVMPVSPMVGNGSNNGFLGGDAAWIVLLLLLGWGNNGGMGGGNNMYPWFNQMDATNAGFQNAQLSAQLGSIQAEIGANNNAALQTGFNIQSAIMNGNYQTSSQLSQCCCENRLATANLSSDIAREACATRTADSQNTQLLLQTITAGIQSIKDQMCNDKIDAKNEKIADLERQLSQAQFAASQTAQTAKIINDNNLQTVSLERYLNPTPIPAYIVANPNGGTTTTAG